MLNLVHRSFGQLTYLLGGMGIVAAAALFPQIGAAQVQSATWQDWEGCTAAHFDGHTIFNEVQPGFFDGAIKICFDSACEQAGAEGQKPRRFVFEATHATLGVGLYLFDFERGTAARIASQNDIDSKVSVANKVLERCRARNIPLQQCSIPLSEALFIESALPTTGKTYTTYIEYDYRSSASERGRRIKDDAFQNQPTLIHESYAIGYNVPVAALIKTLSERRINASAIQVTAQELTNDEAQSILASVNVDFSGFLKPPAGINAPNGDILSSPHRRVYAFPFPDLSQLDDERDLLPESLTKERIQYSITQLRNAQVNDSCADLTKFQSVLSERIKKLEALRPAS